METGSKINFELLLREVYSRKLFIVTVFAVISLVMVAIGVNWPKQYSSSTTIYVEEENILGPLMQGAAVQTEVIDRSAIAREIIYGHSFMYKLLEHEGLLEETPDPAEQELLINNIKKRLSISNVQNNLIRIEFRDSDPDRVYQITSYLANRFIEESLEDKAKQSTEAFEFIDKQAGEYKDKLQKAEIELKEFRAQNVDAQPGMAEGIARRISELQNRREQIVQDLKEARIRKASLESQLSGEAQASSAFSRTEQYKTRIAELQSQLDTLRLSYHETYPDIVHLKEQIQDLRNAVSETEKQTNARASVLDERVLSNPVYQQLQRDMYDTNTNIEMLNARREHTEAAIDEQLDRARKISEFEARLQELTRDYEINNTSYSDLMARRERARVSMNLDKEKKGLTLRIDEPAYRPHSPSGIRFMHFLLAGPAIGLVLPVGLIFFIIQLSPSIRTGADLVKIGVPVLGVTPHLATPSEARRNIIGLFVTILVFLGVTALVITAGVLRMQGDL